MPSSSFFGSLANTKSSVDSVVCSPYEVVVLSPRLQVGQLCPRVPLAFEAKVTYLQLLLETQEQCFSVVTQIIN
jgi:hypothetical protein